jgi:hypothetical protein
VSLIAKQTPLESGRFLAWDGQSIPW